MTEAVVRAILEAAYGFADGDLVRRVLDTDDTEQLPLFATHFPDGDALGEHLARHGRLCLSQGLL